MQTRAARCTRGWRPHLVQAVTVVRLCRHLVDQLANPILFPRRLLVLLLVALIAAGQALLALCRGKDRREDLAVVVFAELRSRAGQAPGPPLGRALRLERHSLAARQPPAARELSAGRESRSSSRPLASPSQGAAGRAPAVSRGRQPYSIPMRGQQPGAGLWACAAYAAMGSGASRRHSRSFARFVHEHSQMGGKQANELDDGGWMLRLICLAVEQYRPARQPRNGGPQGGADGVESQYRIF